MPKHLSERRTEDVVIDLLDIQGFSTARPPRGRVVRQNEYKAFDDLGEIFKGRSKTGRGDAYPDFLIVEELTGRPQIVIETKANENDINQALYEACNVYGKACLDAGHAVIAIGIAGQEKTGIRVAVSNYHNGDWHPVSHNGNPISWIPTPKDLSRIIGPHPVLDIAPVVPRPEILANRADFINRILREAGVKDEYRPAYVGAMMLALWHSKGRISREPESVLIDVNRYCSDAFEKADKTELARSLAVNEANQFLANSAWKILATLEQLNVVNAAFDHDYLGQLYETFFRYTGANTIGQYFTPRHITVFMANLCETSTQDVVIDPACGTGGFLVACIQRALATTNVKYEMVVDMVRENLLGYEAEPVTAALCVANMILRGDGKTGIREEDCFKAEDYPLNRCQVSLMNPPFPHKKTDTPPERFVERALEALENRGKLAVVLPTSLLVKKPVGVWRKKLLQNNTLLAVCQMPDELFQPFASATTSVVVLEKGVPHSANKRTVFARVQYDGLTLKKGTRVKRADGKDELARAEDAVINKAASPGFSGVELLRDDFGWGAGAYIPSAIPTDEELKTSVDELLRRLASFYVRYAPEVARLRHRVALGDEEQKIDAQEYQEMLTKGRLKNAADLPHAQGTIGGFFDIYYGQKELHSRDGIPEGDSLVVSPTEQYNGCYGWLTFAPLLKPPFVTVAQTGTIGEAFVQMEPCGVNDDCLVLLPKRGLDLPLSCLFIAAAIIRLEKWRFSYGRKLTPARICEFKMTRIPDVEKWVQDAFTGWRKITEAAVNQYLKAVPPQIL